MKVSHDVSIPLYMQVYHHVLKLIESGEYQNGDKLPSQQELAQRCGVSMVTVRKALEQLMADEIITTKHGTGSFVTLSQVPQQVFAGGSFTDACRMMNKTPETKIVSKTLQPAGRRVASALGVTAGEEILCIQRLRLMDQKACILESDYFTQAHLFLMDQPMANRSLLGILCQAYQVEQFQFDDFCDVAFASAEQAKLLDCMANIPLLRVSQIVRDGAQKILYYNEQLVRSDRYRYAITSVSCRK